MTTALLFHFDDAAPFADAAGHTVTQNASPATGDPTGEYGSGAMDCSGGGYLTIGSAADLGLAAGTAYTIDLRVWLPNTTVGSTTRYWLFGSDTAAIGFMRIAGDPAWYLIARRDAVDTNAALFSPGITTYNTPIHLRAGRATDGKIYLFIDGVFKNITAGISAQAVSQSGWFVGRPSAGAPVFPGFLEEARFTPGSNLTTTTYTPPSAAWPDPPTPGPSALPLAVSVVPSGTSALPIDVTVSPSGVAALALAVSVLPPDLIAGTRTIAGGSGGVAGVWRPVVTVAGADMSAQIIGEISTGGEEDGARLADFSLRLLSGAVVDLPSWSGAPVTIDIADGAGNYAMRLFAGVVDLPSLDLDSRTLILRCTDGLQTAVAALSNAAIAALVGGTWSAAVFDATATGWAYAKDLLSTVPSSLDRSPDGALRVTSWAAKASADLAITASHYESGSLSVEPADRASLINTVDISFGYRFPRLHADTYIVDYTYVDMTFFASYVSAGNWFLQRQAVLNALSATGGGVVGEVTWVPLPTSAVALGGGAYWTPGPADGLLCMGFAASMAFDFARQTEETHQIRVVDTAGVAAMGTLRRTLTGALEGAYPEQTAAETNLNLYRADVTTIPPPDIAAATDGFRTTAEPTLSADTDRAAANAAIETLIAVAKTDIWRSSRGSRVRFTVPLNPAIDLDKTLSVTGDGVAAKGKVCAITHRMDPASGRAVSDVTLAICSIAGVGIPHPEDPTAYSAASTSPAVPLAVTPTVVFNHGPTEDHSITITFPGVDAVERAKAAVTLASTVRATIAEDLFTYTQP